MNVSLHKLIPQCIKIQIDHNKCARKRERDINTGFLDEDIDEDYIWNGQISAPF